MSDQAPLLPATTRALGPVEAVRRALRLGLTFSGRSRRSEYWWFQLAVILVALLIAAVAGSIFGPEVRTETVIDASGRPPPSQETTWIYSGGIFGATYYLISQVPLTAVTWRRLQDRDISGWWSLAFTVCTLLWWPSDDLVLTRLGFDAFGPALPVGVVIFVTLSMIIFSLWLLIQMLSTGTRGPNRFGPDPLEVTP